MTNGGYKDIENQKEEDVKEKELKLHKNIKQITSVILFYIFVSVLLVFLNKYILSYSTEQFGYPLFITWIQLIMQLVLTILFGAVGKVYAAYFCRRVTIAGSQYYSLLDRTSSSCRLQRESFL
jgi:hypothetical protein